MSWLPKREKLDPKQASECPPAVRPLAKQVARVVLILPWCRTGTSTCRVRPIPTIAGGTFSPDFMYVVKRKDGTKILNLIVETKDYDRVDQIPPDQMVKIECAKVFFANLEAEGYKVVFNPQFKQDKIAGIIADVLKD